VLIIRVGRGCGFVVKIHGKRLVLSAAHNLPVYRQYEDLALCTEVIGALGSRPSIAGVCLSIDVVNDICAIGMPSYPHRAAFERMILSAGPFAVAPAKERRGSVMTLDGSWEPVRIDHIAGLSLTILLEREIDLSGTSGAPILNADGAAVGLVACQIPGRSGYGPHLVASLPAALAPCTRLSRRLSPRPSRPQNRQAASTGT
jgi:hypothetical protein